MPSSCKWSWQTKEVDAFVGSASLFAVEAKNLVLVAAFGVSSVEDR